MPAEIHHTPLELTAAEYVSHVTAQAIVLTQLPGLIIRMNALRVQRRRMVVGQILAAEPALPAAFKLQVTVAVLCAGNALAAA